MKKILFLILATIALAAPDFSSAGSYDDDYTVTRHNDGDDYRGGIAYGPDGITTWSGGKDNGIAYGPKGITTWYGGDSGGIAYGPNGITTWYGNGGPPISH